MNDCDAEAENTVGRSSSMSRSEYSLYKLYTLPIHFIWRWNETREKANNSNYFNGKLFPFNTTSCTSNSISENRKNWFLQLKLIRFKFVQRKALNDVIAGLTLSRPFRKCCWVSLRMRPRELENKFLVSSFTLSYCLIKGVVTCGERFVCHVIGDVWTAPLTGLSLISHVRLVAGREYWPVQLPLISSPIL